MIENDSTMDHPVVRARGLSLRTILLLAGGGALLLGTVLVIPTVRRWSRAELVVDGSRIRTGVVVRGDLERDVSAQGRIVAALHPTLFAAAQGIVTLAVKSGAQARKGQTLARIDSPELRSRLAPERATLLSLEADLGRQEIGARQAGLRSRQNIEVLGVRSAAAGRAMERAQRSLDESGGGRRAWVVDQGIATLREIQVGATSVGEVEIVRGLEPGATIVLSDTTLFGGAKTVLLRN